MQKICLILFVLSMILAPASAIYVEVDKAQQAETTSITSTNNNKDVAVTSISISPSNYNLNVGSEYKLTVYVYPSNASNRYITFSSSNASIATIDSFGYVRGIKVGTAIITAYSQSNRNIKSTCTINVVDPNAYYIITYNLNGGSISGVNPEAYRSTNSNITLNNPTREGYTFKGWTGSNGNTPQTIVTIQSGSSGNKSYTANWTPINYSITYNLNGGTNNYSNPYTYNTDQSITLNAPTKDGATFTGWTGSNGSTPQKNVTISKGSTGNKTYTANWTLTSYTISYNLNGGSVSGNPTSYTSNDSYTLKNPTKIGYNFVGWTGSNGSNAQTSVSIQKGSFGSKSYTANWAPVNYSVNYVLNEGTFGSYHPTSLTYDSTATISNPTKPYATFTGWTIDGMDNVTHTYGSSTTTSNAIISTKETSYKNLRSTSGMVTFKANWSYTNYEITYNLDGGINSHKNPSFYTYYDSISLSTPTKNGYTFIGWTGSNGTTPQLSVTINKYSTGDKLYTANWQLADYEISYDLDGGNVSGTNPTSYTINSSSITLINPTRTGYIFAGWTGSNGSTKQTSVTIASGSYGNKSYTANWTPIQYSITYNLNGGTNSSSNYSYYIIETSRTIYSPTRNGYTFVGWTGSNGTIPQTSVTISNGSTGNKSYTANWEIVTYNITYNLNYGVVDGLNPATYTVEDEDITFINPTRDYYEFSYWGNSYCFNSNNKEYGIKKGSYGNKTITAYWTPVNYNITYDLDGGTVSISNKVSYNVETSTFTLNNPTRTGFVFIGWSGTGLTGNNNTNVQIAKGEHGDRQYTANWQANQFTLSFVSNCDIQVDDITQDCGSVLTLPKPVWNNKSLEGWYRDEELTNKFTEQTMPAENLTLYAKWISYDIVITPNELTEISINTELTPAGIGATAIDTDNDNLELILQYTGNFAIGETILIRLSTTGKYSMPKYKTYSQVKVYGIPEVSYNTTKDYINITDELVPSLFNAVGTDTFGGNTTNTLFIKEENYAVGDLVTVVIKFVDVTGNEEIVEITNIKVYGEPTIKCVNEKVKAVEYNAFNATDICAIGYDSYGKEITVNVENITTITTSDIDTGFVNGDTYAYTTSNIQNIKIFTAYNTEKYTLYYKNSSSSSSNKTNVIIYCKTTNTTIYSFYSSNTSYSSYSFNVTAGYSYYIITKRYSNSATFYMYLRSATNTINSTLYPTIYPSVNFVGKVITLKLTATDDFGNSYTKNVDLKVCGTPTISEPTKTLFKDTEVISYETLGIISKDSFNDEITNVSIQLISGELVAGSILQYLVTATDIVGNQAQKTISNIKVYGIPTISYNIDKKGIKVTDTINASLFGATAKDSFNNNLTVQAEIYSGTMTAGQNVKIKFTATDCVGNIKEIITDYIGVYSVNDITLTYNQYLSDFIKSTSKGEEFNAVAKDSFNNNIELRIVATNGTLAGGNVISLKLVATDNAGNTKESEIINNIKVYDTPSISCNLERVYLYDTADNIELYIVAVDSFGDEIVPSIQIKSGEKVAGQTVTYLVRATDKAGNTKESEYTFNVIGDNQAYVTFNVDGGSAINIDFYGITLNQEYELPTSTKTDYTFMGWYDNNGVQYTNRTGNSIKQFTNKGEFTLIAHWQLKHLINYELNGGSFDGNYPTSYTEEDVITLVVPTKTGYTFTGWTGSNGSTPQTSVTISQGSTGNKSYTANWTPIQYSITYNLNDGSVNGTNPASYTIESSDITLINPTREYYIFTGWTGSNGSTPQTSVTIASGSTGNKEYTANWTSVQYSITYNLNGGNVNGTNPTTYTIESDDITLINPTRDYYTFAGWTGSNGSTKQTSVTIASGSYGNRSYTASWTPIQYTITYNLNDGVNNEDNPEHYDIESDDIFLYEPFKIGYSFVGWTGSNGTTPETSVTITQGSTGNKTYTANWEIANYTITYNLYGGNVNGTNPTTYTIESDNITLVNPTKNGYTFTGWTGSNSSTPQTSVTIAQGSTGNKSYTANWTLVQYTITYNLDDGVNDEDNPEHYDIENDDIFLYEPFKNGYFFVGWTGSNGSIPQISVTISQGSTGNKTYTANWTHVQYSITYNLNGGSVNGTNPTTYTINSSSITLINPTRTGYTFAGWTGSNGTTKQTSVTIASGSYGNKSYTANWTPIQYSITYNLNGGTNSSSNYSYYTIETARTIYGPTKNGYTFVGWTGSNGTIPQTSVIITQGSTGNKSYTANWTAIEYSITYNLNYGSVNGTNPTIYTIESDNITLINPTKNGYTFTGWTGSNGSTPQTSVTITQGSTGNKSYIVNWTPVQYTITYNLNGGSVNGTNPTTYNVESDSITLINPTRTGCTFAGWTGSNGTTPRTSVTISQGSIGNKSYTANWELANYTITYHIDNSVDNSMNISQFTVNNLNFALNSPKYDEHYFVGWYTDAEYENSITNIDNLCDYDIYGKFLEASSGLTYKSKSSSENYYVINGYSGTDSILVLPDYHAGYEVKKIYYGAFKNNKVITSVYMSNNITEFGNSIFEGCSNLETITISKNVTIINERDFYNCSNLNSVFFYEESNLSEIKLYAFAKCSSLEFIELPNKLTKLDSLVFDECSNLLNISIPNGIKYIGSHCLQRCDKLNYNIDGNALYIGNKDNEYLVLMKYNGTSSFTMDNRTKVIMSDCFSYNFSGVVTFSNNLTQIGDSAFWGSNVQSIDLPDTLLYIGGQAFYNTPISSLYIPKHVLSIGQEAFSNCSNITSISVDENNTIFDSRNNCNAIIRKSTKTLIKGCKNTIIPNDIEIINAYAFYGCTDLTNISIPQSVKEVGQHAFSYCTSLNYIIIPSSVKCGPYLFWDCVNLTIYCEVSSKPNNWNSSWNLSRNSERITAYWYSETQPTTSGNYWHYVDGVVTKWE